MDSFFAHKRYSKIDFLIGDEAGPFSVIFWWWVVTAVAKLHDVQEVSVRTKDRKPGFFGSPSGDRPDLSVWFQCRGLCSKC